MKTNLRYVVLLALCLIVGSMRVEDRSINILHFENEGLFKQPSFQGGSVRVQASGQRIIHKDGSVSQANPPVDILGSHLLVTGDFRITIGIKEIGDGGVFRLYAAPPRVYDEWRYEPPSVEVSFGTSTTAVYVWDGTSSTPIDMREFAPLPWGRATLFIERQGGQIAVGVNGETQATIPEHGVFGNKEIWFGADANSSRGWVLAALSAEPRGTGRLAVAPYVQFMVPRTGPTSLRVLAEKQKHPIRIGAAISFTPLLTDDAYRKVAIEEFSIWTPENGMKPQFIHPDKNTYSFGDMDAFVRIAKANDIQVHGHALVYAKSDPAWMTESPPSQLQHILAEHIQTIVGHFKGRVSEWDVVNEPMSSKQTPYKDERQGLDDTLWYKAMGEGYIDAAFAAAHAADPAAVLYLNDYGLEKDGQRWDAFLSLVKRLQARGVQINGIGFEAHVYGDGDYIDRGQLKKHMEQLAKLGLLVRISEIDVTGDDADMQVSQYADALDVCLREPNCTSYTTWGVSDQYGSTTRSDRYPLVFGTSLLWDTEMKAKPAVDAIKERLLKK